MQLLAKTMFKKQSKDTRSYDVQIRKEKYYREDNVNVQQNVQQKQAERINRIGKPLIEYKIREWKKIKRKEKKMETTEFKSHAYFRLQNYNTEIGGSTIFKTHDYLIDRIYSF